MATDPSTIPCPACGRGSPAGSRYCAGCGEPLVPASSTPTRAVSRSAAGPRRPTGADAASSIGDARPEERFLPGRVLAGRYRIVGPIGRGGMGEVYRADDLKLGQPVALKFLPERLQHDPDRLRHLLNEVRLARQVSHPHVCRVYDVGEVDGHHFLSMEYVDGEDLASLLRRIGRLPKDKAIQLARQICAGLAAAHDVGVLHRDLKPSNIMIDGRGRARLTDFGLAALSERVDEGEVRYGTPAYMAPEQFEGKEVSARSDLYALGLVLYELFTGNPPYAADSVEELRRARTETAPLSPSSLVENFDPAVERVILRCLETEPLSRPSSALAVAAALPGGDPLAAALAAGETPSPEMVAEADDPRRMRAGIAWGALALLVVLLAGSLLLSERRNLVSLARLERPPEYLQERARDLLRELGDEGEPADSLYEFLPDLAYLDYLQERWPGPGGWDVLAEAQPPAIRFHYRESPQPLTRISQASIGDWMGDPPMTLPGMTAIALDPQGRLEELRIIPPERASVTGGAPDWDAALSAAGFAPSSLTEVEPEWLPPDFADRRAAWTGSHPEAPDIPVRVEVAALGGRLVSFRIIRPWTRPAEAPQARRGFWVRVGDWIQSLWFLVVLVTASVVALRNVRTGRGDVRGAFRLALYLGAVRMLWLLGIHLGPSGDRIGLLIGHMAYAMYRVGLVYVFYLAVEPYARRVWPQVLVSWVRLLEGRFRDPLVGRSLLLGSLGGAAIAVIIALGAWLPELMGGPPVRPNINNWALEALRGLRGALVAVIGVHTTEMIEIIFPVTMLLILRLLTRRTWIAMVVVCALSAPMFWPGTGSVPGYLVSIVLVFVIYLAVLFRAGFLGLIVCTTSFSALLSLPVSLDPSAWNFGSTLLLLVVGLGPALYGLRSILAAPRPAPARPSEASALASP